MIDRLLSQGDRHIRTTNKKVGVISLLAEAWWIGFVRPTSDEIRNRVLPLSQKYYVGNSE
jgi:hypothetical protein